MMVFSCLPRSVDVAKDGESEPEGYALFSEQLGGVLDPGFAGNAPGLDVQPAACVNNGVGVVHAALSCSIWCPSGLPL
jgi:hypothetical protein